MFIKKVVIGFELLEFFCFLRTFSNHLPLVAEFIDLRKHRREHKTMDPEIKLTVEELLRIAKTEREEPGWISGFYRLWNKMGRARWLAAALIVLPFGLAPFVL